MKKLPHYVKKNVNLSSSSAISSIHCIQGILLDSYYIRLYLNRLKFQSFFEAPLGLFLTI